MFASPHFHLSGLRIFPAAFVLRGFVDFVARGMLGNGGGMGAYECVGTVSRFEILPWVVYWVHVELRRKNLVFAEAPAQMHSGQDLGGRLWSSRVMVKARSVDNGAWMATRIWCHTLRHLWVCGSAARA